MLFSRITASQAIFMSAAVIAGLIPSVSTGQAADPVAGNYRAMQERFFTDVQAAGEIEVRRSLTARYAADLERLGSAGRGNTADRALIESSVYFHFAGEGASADRALAAAMQRTNRDTSWENKMLLLQALQELPGRGGEARRMLRSFMPEAKADPVRSRELAVVADKLGLRQEAVMLGSRQLSYDAPPAAGTADSADTVPADTGNPASDPPPSSPSSTSSKATSRKNLKDRKPFDFVAKEHRTGRELDMQDYRGKVVLLDFWATWCGPCVAELPAVKKTYKDFHSRGFEIVGISLDNDLGKLDAFLRQHGMNWPQIADGGGWKAELAVRYGIKSIPSTILIGPDGNAIANNLRGERLYQTVEQVIKAK